MIASKKKKLILGFFPTFFCLLAMLLSACGGPAPAATGQAAPASKQIFRYPIIGGTDISTFDPALVQDTSSSTAIQAVFTGLEQFNDKGEVVDQLAASHQVSSDGLTYTFKLRPNLKFSDGTSLTASDVVYSINRTLVPATKSQVTNYLSLLQDYKKITAGTVPTLIGDSLIAQDDSTVVMKISSPAAYFLSMLTYPTSYVVEKSLITKYGTNWTDHLSEGGGDGPFKVQSWNHTKGIVMVPNPNYYGTKPQIQKFEFTISGDTETTYKAYQAGQFDYTGPSGVPTANVEAARKLPEFHEFPILTTSFLQMNFLTKPFDNIKIRQAFALAINKDTIVKNILKNTVVSTWNFVPKGMYGYDASLVGPDGVTTETGDATKAKQLFQEGLTEEGYSSVAALPPLEIVFNAPSVTTTNWVAAITQMWQNTLGVSVKTNVVSFPKRVDLIDATKNNASGLKLWRDAWQADYPDPQDWLSLFFKSGADSNNMNYGQNKSADATAQQAVQQTLAQADMTQDKAQRLQLYNDAEQKIINDVGVLPLWQFLDQVQIKPYVHGLTYNSLDIIPPDDWGNIYITQ